jgi:hypothetical protein
MEEGGDDGALECRVDERRGEHADGQRHFVERHDCDRHERACATRVGQTHSRESILAQLPLQNQTV